MPTAMPGVNAQCPANVTACHTVMEARRDNMLRIQGACIHELLTLWRLPPTVGIALEPGFPGPGPWPMVGSYVEGRGSEGARR